MRGYHNMLVKTDLIHEIHISKITDRHWFMTRFINQSLLLSNFWYVFYLKMILLDLTCCTKPHVLITKAPDFWSKDFFLYLCFIITIVWTDKIYCLTRCFRTLLHACQYCQEHQTVVSVCQAMAWHSYIYSNCQLSFISSAYCFQSLC